MNITSMARIALVSVIFGTPALAQAPAGNAPANQDPAPKQDAPAKKADTSKYSGIVPLIRTHRDKQAAMVKLWREIKKGNGDEKTRDQYKDAQMAAQKASNSVSKFIAQEHWTDADRAIMNKMWSDELEKPIE
jgi:hypothetical protein